MSDGAVILKLARRLAKISEAVTRLSEQVSEIARRQDGSGCHCHCWHPQVTWSYQLPAAQPGAGSTWYVTYPSITTSGGVPGNSD